MREYKKYIWATILVSVLTILPAFYLHYKVPCSEADFWIDICLGIFAGAFLTLITSIISYNREKKRTLEGFLYHTRRILRFLEKYQSDMSQEQKMRYFINYSDLDITDWDKEYGDMDFFFSSKAKKKYIYNKIYIPIWNLTDKINNNSWHFKNYFIQAEKSKNESTFNKNTNQDDANMEKYIEKIEEILLERNSHTIRPKFIINIRKELNEHYTEIMYGKRDAKKLSKLQEEELNGQDENADGE